MNNGEGLQRTLEGIDWLVVAYSIVLTPVLIVFIMTLFVQYLTGWRLVD